MSHGMVWLDSLVYFSNYIVSVRLINLCKMSVKMTRIFLVRSLVGSQ